MTLHPLSGQPKIRVVRTHTVKVITFPRNGEPIVTMESRQRVLFKGSPTAFEIWSQRHQVLGSDQIENSYTQAAPQAAQ